MELYKLIKDEHVRGEAIKQLAGLLEKAGTTALETIEMDPESCMDLDKYGEVAEAKAAYEEACAIFLAEGPGPDDVNKKIMDNYRAALGHCFESEKVAKERASQERSKSLMLAGLHGAFEVSKVVAKSYISSQLGVKL